MKKNFLRFIFNFFNLYEIVARIKSPKLVAVVLFLTSSILKSGKSSSPNIIYIHKGIGIDDILSMYKNSKKINYIVIQSALIREIFKVFFGAKIYSISSIHTDYHNDLVNFPEEKKHQYRKFIKKVFDYFQKICSYDGFLTSNYVYAYLQELSNYANENKKIYIILYKEGLVNKNFVEKFIHRYTNNSLNADLMLTYNSFIKNAFIKSNIKGVQNTSIVPIGIPRLDNYKNLKKSNHHIVLFSFLPKDKFSYLENEAFYDLNFQNKIEKISNQFHSNVIKYANENPSKKLIIKTKFPPKYMNYIEAIINQNNLKISKNISVINSGNPLDIIKNSNTVMGFNSTTLLEALLLKKKIVIPNFTEILSNDFNIDYFTSYKKIAYKVSSYNEMNYAINSDFKNNSTDIDSFLEKYIHHNNFSASKNAENTILLNLNCKDSK